MVQNIQRPLPFPLQGLGARVVQVGPGVRQKERN